MCAKKTLCDADMKTLRKAICEIAECYNAKRSIKHDNLHIVSSAKHEHGSYYGEPQNIVDFNRLRMRLPSISINNVLVNQADPGTVSLCIAAVISKYGYFLASSDYIISCLAALPSLLYMTPPDKPTVLDVLLFRQRVLFALARGCHVIVCVGSASKEVQKVAKLFKLNRTCRIGLERLHTLCPTSIKHDKVKPLKSLTVTKASQKGDAAFARKSMGTSLRYKVLTRDRYKCVLCGRSPASSQRVKLHVDHIIPVAKGGSSEPKNLRTLCRDCNAGKSAKLPPVEHVRHSKKLKRQLLKLRKSDKRNAK